MESAAEEILPGGNVAAAVVRVGQTVRKPVGPHTPAVAAFLAHLHAAGFSGAPRTLGRDDQGRHVLEYVPGVVAHDLPPLDLAGLHRVGVLVRELHDVSAGFVPPPAARWWVAIPPDRAELICHHDLAPWNLVLAEDRWVFIDWDGAGPGSRLWDLAYAIKAFVPLQAGGDPAADGQRVRVLADGYRLTAAQRADLPGLIGAHTRGMHDLLRRGAESGVQPWARLHSEGHGTYWGQSADYIERHLPEWTHALSRPGRRARPRHGPVQGRNQEGTVNLALRYYADMQERAARIGRHFERARHWGAVQDAERLHRADKEHR